MTREEIKEEILKDEQEQTHITLNAQFAALNTLLIKKGILEGTDIDEIYKLTQEYIEKLNEKLVDRTMEYISKVQDE